LFLPADNRAYPIRRDRSVHHLKLMGRQRAQACPEAKPKGLPQRSRIRTALHHIYWGMNEEEMNG